MTTDYAVTARCACGQRFTREVTTEADAALVVDRGQCDGCYAREQQARDMEE